MVEVLEGLKTTNILYKKNVSDLKLTIEQRYPHYSSEYKAKLFAHAIHKIIDTNISHFDKDLQPHIKNKLLQKVITKDIFDITAYDVFEVCHSLNESNERYFESLTTWINTTQSTSFSKDQVYNLKLTPSQTLENTVLLSSSAVTKDKVLLDSTETLGHTKPPKPLHLEFQTTVSTNHRSYLSPMIKYLKIHPALLALTLLISLVGMTQLQLFYKRNIYSEPVSITTDITLAEEASPSATFIEHEDLSVGPDNHLQDHLQYKEIDTETLADFLTSRGSLLVEQPYFDSIIDVAREFNINPLLMFAITGQEQGFVPKSNPQAESIVNNPFNVFGSWQDFNTDIKDTSSIAARTILNLSKGCPEDEDPIKWLNKQYAEDPNWHVGVSQILNQLEDIAGQ